MNSTRTSQLRLVADAHISELLWNFSWTCNLYFSVQSCISSCWAKISFQPTSCLWQPTLHIIDCMKEECKEKQTLMLHISNDCLHCRKISFQETWGRLMKLTVKRESLNQLDYVTCILMWLLLMLISSLNNYLRVSYGRESHILIWSSHPFSYTIGSRGTD